MPDRASPADVLGGPASCSARPAQPRDLPVLAIFERELARLSFPDDPILDLSYHERKLARALAAQPDGMIVLTEEETGEIVAWVWLATRKTLATGETYGIVRSLFVRPDFRRRGLGRCLADYARRYFEAKDLTTVYAKLHADNEAAIKLLRQIGFEELHVTLQMRTGRT